MSHLSDAMDDKLDAQTASPTLSFAPIFLSHHRVSMQNAFMAKREGEKEFTVGILIASGKLDLALGSFSHYLGRICEGSGSHLLG